MNDLSRRHFLKQLGALPAVFLAARGTFAGFETQTETTPFEFLVVGDSLVWGQGLEEKDKFYTLTKNWLETEAFGERVPVNLKVKAHSGATLTPHENELKALQAAGKDETKYYNSEINVGFPSIKTQLDLAAKEYAAANTPNESIRLIMLSGGITDISVAALLNPFGDNDQLRRDIDKYCSGSMTEVLGHAATLFPNALIAVIGYYPMISPKTPAHDLFNFTLEAYGVPRPLKPVVNNLLTKQFFKIIKKKAIKRSRIWMELSEAKLRDSVDKLNARQTAARAVYINSPINEGNTFGTNDLLVFRMLKKGRIEDPQYDERKEFCGPTLNELKKSTGLKYPIRFCDMAAIGHPNPAGSRLFSESIKSVLGPLVNAGRK
ncbi:MAG: hypothetical protein IPN69_24855 [Acidobacteria bacterium]|nr:hypothetical protein [Acidobacteriota bacterium]MBK8147519.1 hypothetical protein [Acidobacteriota bacterium]MBK8813942.1 hypothetical protein [Acidobacteriota bacterium]